VDAGRRVALAVGIGDGVIDPPAPAEEIEWEDQILLADVGGAEALLAQVEWFRSALPGAA
jgi:hypothetical protein